MKRIFFILCIAAVLSSCVRTLDGTEAVQPADRSLALSLKSAGSVAPLTKMTSDATQSSGSAFRGIQSVYIISFNMPNSGPVTAGQPSLHGGFGSQYPGFSSVIENNNSHLFKLAMVPHLTNRVLVYGETVHAAATTQEQKHRTGVLNPVGVLDPAGSSDISFTLEGILDDSASSDFEADVNSLIGALNNVVATFQSFGNTPLLGIIDAVCRENQILACSYSTMDRFKQEIAQRLSSVGLAPEIANAVNLALSSFGTAISDVGTDFPRAYGIPEGAVGFWWNGNRFVRLISGVNIALVSPESYCYPPSLWYYVNSTVKTSRENDIDAQFTPSNPYWASILKKYTDGGMVEAVTRSVAIVDSLQYGVGLMEMSVKAAVNDQIAPVLGCPLTGIIFEQADVDFNFTPLSSPHDPARFVYDNVVGTSTALSTSDMVVVETLLLPTGSKQKMHFALEFENTTNTTLRGQQGDILPWCKFYLAGELVLPPGEERGIITRDCKTTVTAIAADINKAYNTVPDLREPQLEIGIMAELQWQQISPSSVKINL